jgi:hypothetical protein
MELSAAVRVKRARSQSTQNKEGGMDKKCDCGGKCGELCRCNIREKDTGKKQEKGEE